MPYEPTAFSRHTAGQWETSRITVVSRDQAVSWVAAGQRLDAGTADSLQWSQIQMITSGKHGDGFESKAGDSAQDACCFSIVTRDGLSLDLEASSPAVRDAWVLALKEDLEQLAGAPAVEFARLAVKKGSGQKPGKSQGKEVVSAAQTEKQLSAGLKAAASGFSVVNINPGFRGKPASSTLYYTDEKTEIWWCPRGDSTRVPGQSVSLTAVTDLYAGKSNSALVNTPGLDDARLFSIVHGDVSLDFEAATAEARDAILGTFCDILKSKGKGTVEQQRFRFSELSTTEIAAIRSSRESVNLDGMVVKGAVTKHDVKGDKPSVDLKLSCSSLAQLDAFGAADPMVVVFERTEKPESPEREYATVVGQTDCVKGESSPIFQKKLTLSQGDGERSFRFCVYDVQHVEPEGARGASLDAKQLIGSADVTFSQLTQAAKDGKDLSLALRNATRAKVDHKLQVKQSKITIRATSNQGSAAAEAKEKEAADQQTVGQSLTQDCPTLSKGVHVTLYHALTPFSMTYVGEHVTLQAEFGNDLLKYSLPAAAEAHAHASLATATGHVIRSGSFALHLITQVLVGKQTPCFNAPTHPAPPSNDHTAHLAPSGGPSHAFHEHEGFTFVEDRCFSIVAGGRTLDLEAHSKPQRDAIVQELTTALTRYGSKAQNTVRYHVKQGVEEGLPDEMTFEGEIKGTQEKTDKKLILQVACRDIPRTDWLSESDPIVGVWITDEKTGKRLLLDQTEWIKDEKNPNYVKRLNIYLPKDANKDLTLQFRCYDVEVEVIRPQDFIGSADVSLKELLGAVGDTMAFPLTNTEDKDLERRLDAQNSRIVLTPTLADPEQEALQALINPNLQGCFTNYSSTVTSPYLVDVFHATDEKNKAGGYLYWAKRGERTMDRNSRIAVSDIGLITLGKQSTAFTDRYVARSARGPHCFSIYLKGQDQSVLDLQADSRKARKAFISLLQEVINNMDDTVVVHDKKYLFWTDRGRLPAVSLLSPRLRTFLSATGKKHQSSASSLQAAPRESTISAGAAAVGYTFKQITGDGESKGSAGNEAFENAKEELYADINKFHGATNSNFFMVVQDADGRFHVISSQNLQTTPLKGDLATVLFSAKALMNKVK